MLDDFFSTIDRCNIYSSSKKLRFYLDFIFIQNFNVFHYDYVYVLRDGVPLQNIQKIKPKA